MRKMVVASMALGMLLVAGAAQAEDKFGTGIILGVDRLWGIGMYSQTQSSDENGVDYEEKTSRTAVNLLLAGSPASVYQVPRLAFDYGLGNGLTVGGNLGYISQSGSSQMKKPSEGEEVDLPKTSGFLIAPRVGYALELAEGIYIWPRAGITYYSTKTTIEAGAAKNEDTLSGFGLNVEGMLLWSPVPHFGLTIGPVFDYTLSGKAKSKQTGAVTAESEKDMTEMNIGLASGIVGWF
ncbi:MAG TPA: hypothetical protein PLI95_04425 [Polyangiaceae bacterium]|nr:hypothetical protein [Polyangiaceae bacterium]